MKRLYLQFYLTIVASLVLVVLTGGLLFGLLVGHWPVDRAFQMAGEIAVAAIPPLDAPREAQQRAIDRLAERRGVDLALYDAERAPIAAAGRPLPAPGRFRRGGGWLYGATGPAWSIRLPDGRWLVAGVPSQRWHPGFALIVFLGGAALVVALVALPVVRRVTRRLERLQTSVESLGSGDLSARVKIEGRDEVARLAESFNRAAARIESLVGAHKMLLANASHELRTPLTRIRLGVELLRENADPKRKAELEADIAELDLLIDEILLASRLDAAAALDTNEETDLLALAAEECARSDACSLTGDPVLVRGDPRLLRRMIRNLIVNAEQHGKPPIEAQVRSSAGRAVLRICDRGPGIAETERARLFLPFQRTAAGGGGAGLGLALVRQIAQRHSGDVAYGACDGRASCFTVTLPLARPAT
ncbi:MAG TPA: HAMP domain-containing sensor histidine kinase [Xanthobacteraceae bacterium]|nr:HAMP domain-containing sensor histidine kinase [Xanthobacteraceae bacterium]